MDPGNLGLPCTRCQKIGHACTAEAKGLTSTRPRKRPIARAPRTSVELRVADLDAKFLRFIHEQYFAPIRQRDMTMIIGRGTLIPIYRLDVPSSLLVRAAVLVLSSYLHDWKPNINTFQYLAEFFVQANEAIKTRALLELLYSSYIMVVYSCCCVESFESVLVNCLQFCRVVRAWMAQKATNLDVDSDWIVTLWQSSMSAVFNIHRLLYIISKRGKAFYLDSMPPAPVDDNWRMEITIKDMLDITDVLSSLLLLEPSNITITARQQLQTFLIYKQIYFENFLHEVNYKADLTVFRVPPHPDVVVVVRSAIARQQLVQVLDRITEVVSGIPNVAPLLKEAQDLEPYLKNHPHQPPSQYSFLRRFPPLFRHDNARVERSDLYSALIYFSATLFLGMLDPNVDRNETSQRLIFHSALALCRLAHGSRQLDADNFSLIRRSVFWAGLVLTKRRFPLGNATQKLELTRTTSQRLD